MNWRCSSVDCEWIMGFCSFSVMNNPLITRKEKSHYNGF
jgi:hypothetical protein